MLGDGFDEQRQRFERVAILPADESWILLSIGEPLRHAGKFNHIGARTQRQDGLAVAILVLDELFLSSRNALWFSVLV